METQFICETGKKYKKLNFLLAPWDQINAELEKIDWADMEVLSESDTTAALNLFHEKILVVLERLVPVKKIPTSISKSSINKMRRTIWRRVTKIKKKIHMASSVQQLTTLIQKKRELEEQLKADYSAENFQQEDKAIFNGSGYSPPVLKTTFQLIQLSYPYPYHAPVNPTNLVAG